MTVQLSDVRLRMLVRVSEFTSDNVDMVELIQLGAKRAARLWGRLN